MKTSARKLRLLCHLVVSAGWMSCCATAQSNCLVFGILELVGIDEQSTCCETVATAAPAVLAGSVVDRALVVLQSMSNRMRQFAAQKCRHSRLPQ